MPPEDNLATTSEEPTTPEMASNDHSGDQRVTVLPPTAPKGKPKAPPLIHGKVKQNELDDEVPVGNGGSKIPLLKTKHIESDQHAERKKRNSTSLFPLSGSQSTSSVLRKGIGGTKSTMEVHRTVEKVRLPKGIEMRRVVQESHGIKAKKYGSTVQNAKTASVKQATKEPSQASGSGTGTHRRKMTKTEASFPEVKSFSGHLRLTGSGSSLACKSKSNEAVCNNSPDNNRNTSPEKMPIASISKAANDETVTATEVPDPAPEFKTIDEFLKMPETALPETKQPPQASVKKTIYKSKFWNYLDPKASNNSKHATKEHKKPYDADAVKDFMQKQKELRRTQQQKELQEKEAESAKRQRMLKELDSKCHKIAVKAKLRSMEEGTAVSAQNAEDAAKKPKLESQSPSLKYLKPLLERKQGSLLRKSDAYTRDVARQSQYLLMEFENIVKRECISIFEKIPESTKIPVTTEKVDKAVGTSASLLDLSSINSCSEHKQSRSDGGITELESLEQDEDVKHPKIPSPAVVERAVTKIQALYRGYRVRKALKDANIFYHKPFHKRRSEILHDNATVTDKSNQSNGNRRWSFPRMPEKPYDNLSRLQPMSPIHFVGKSFNSLVTCYIPPPPPSSDHTPRSPSRPRVLPSFPLTPNRVYDEPYPKQTRNSMELPNRVSSTAILEEKDSYQSVPSMVGAGSSTHILHNDPSAESLKNMPQLHSVPCDFEFAIPSSVPSILDVLREKIRLFSSESNDQIQRVDALLTAGTSKVAQNGASESGSHLRIKPSKDSREGPVNLVKESRSLSSTTIDDDRGVDHEDGATPKIRRHHKRRSRPKSQRSPAGDSSTTVDTDADYVPSPSRSSASLSKLPIQSAAAHASTSTNGSKSEEILRSSTMEDPTTTSSFDNYLAPALQLRYEAEREHLKIIEKALHVRLQSNVPAVGSNESVRNIEQPQQAENSKKSSPETDRVQLAIANCHKESMKAAAEMAKWMSEFQKSTKEQDRVQTQHAPVDLAAAVIAAVEHARVSGIEKRKEKRLHDKSKHKMQEDTERQHVHMSTESGSQSSEVISKADKSVETSLSLRRRFEDSHGEKEKKRGYTENSGVTRTLKDYQQQFPSGSERDSPLPVVPSTLEIAQDRSKGITSRLSSPEDEASKFQDPIDYPSIIPSGNSVDFTSFDPRVSTLEYVSQMSSEKEGASLNEEATEQPSSLDKISPQPSIDEMISEKSGNLYDEMSHHSKAIEDVASLEHSNANVVEDGSNELSKIEDVVSEYSDVVEDVSVAKPIEIIEEEYDDQSEKAAISTESKIEEIISEHSKFTNEVTVQSSIEEEIEESENSSVSVRLPSQHSSVIDEAASNDLTKIQDAVSENSDVVIEDVSVVKPVGDGEELDGQSEKVVITTESKIEEIVSENSKLIDEGSSQSTIAEDIENSNQIDIEKNVSVSVRSHLSSFIDYVASSSDHSSIHEAASENLSKVENVVSEVTKDVGMAGPNNKEANQLEEGIISTESKIEEIISQQSKFTDEHSLQSSIEEDSQISAEIEQHAPTSLPSHQSSGIEEAATNEQSKIEDVVSDSSEETSVVKHEKAEVKVADQSEKEAISTESKIEEIISQHSKHTDKASLQSSFEEDVNSSNNVEFEKNASTSLLSDHSSIADEATSSEHSASVADAANEESKIKNVTEIPEMTNDLPETKDSKVEEKAVVESEITPQPSKFTNEPPPQPSIEEDIQNPNYVDLEVNLSSSLSSRSLIVSLSPDKLQVICLAQAELLWDVWKSGDGSPDSFPDINAVMNVMYDKELAKETAETSDSINSNANGNIQLSAELNADVLMCHLIYETIREVLQVGNNFTPFFERVRPGPLALQARKDRIPKTMDSLVKDVLVRVTKIIPSPFFSQSPFERGLSITPPRPRRQGTNRPRELVDKILLEELYEEDYQWTEWWPEEVIISHHLSTKLIQNLIRNALQKRKYVYSQ